MNICATCLSTDRRMVSAKVWTEMLILFPTYRKCDLEQELICWECEATLARMHRFQRQAIRAQHVLKLCTDITEPRQYLSLSRLSSHTKSWYDESVCSQEDSIKTEINDTIDQTYEELDTTVTKSEVNKSTEVSIFNPQIIQIKHENIDQFEENLEEYENDSNLSNNLEELKSQEFLHLTPDEEKFVVMKMTIEEMCETREIDRSMSRYRSSVFKCEECIVGYFSEEKYKDHLMRKHSEAIGAYKCSVCGVRFGRAHSLAQHYAGHFKRYRCRQCAYSHHKLNTIQTHSSAKHEEFKSFDCKLCDKGFVTFYQLRYHVNKTHKERSVCHICDKSFVTPYNLKIHMRLHKNPVLEECPQCGGKYRYLKIHLKTHSPLVRREEAYCIECARQFRSVLTYRNHLTVHARHRVDSEFRHACVHCAARFYNKTNLTRHVAARHSGQFTFVCDTCGKGYHRKDRLRCHILQKHEGVSKPKDKICPFCAKAFSQSHILKNHIRIHTGEKPFQCQHCPWRFTQLTTLKTHIRALHPQHKNKPLN